MLCATHIIEKSFNNGIEMKFLFMKPIRLVLIREAGQIGTTVNRKLRRW